MVQVMIPIDKQSVCLGMMETYLKPADFNLTNTFICFLYKI